MSRLAVWRPPASAARFQLMLSRLRSRGLGWVVDASPGLTMVDQQMRGKDLQEKPNKD